MIFVPNDLSVEIGPRDTPLLPALRKDLRGDSFLYIDRENNSFKGLKNKFAGYFFENPESGERKIIQADMANLPLPDGNVNSIYLGNVFGQHGVPNRFNSKVEVNIGNLDQIVKEQKRVLKIAGKVIILETTGTGEIFTKGMRKSQLIDAYLKNGFVLLEKYNGTNQISKIFDKKEEIIRLGISASSAEISYALVFEKRF